VSLPPGPAPVSSSPVGPAPVGPASDGPAPQSATGGPGLLPAQAVPQGRGRRRRTVLWAAVGAGAAVAAIIAVAASAQPSGEVTGSSPLLGQQAPAVSGPGLAGGRYSLAQFHHEWVLVNFMASWCTACRQEMPQLEEFYRQHARAGDATVLAIEYDQADTSALRSYLAGQGANWPAVDDPSASVPYGVEGLPSSFLVAPGGTVYAYLLGGVRAAQLDRYMRQGAVKGLGRD
jgi:cytochrome c biogenesis protein CcmG, thiol:disulfide interchange protein DsbE